MEHLRYQRPLSPPKFLRSQNLDRSKIWLLGKPSGKKRKKKRGKRGNKSGKRVNDGILLTRRWGKKRD